MLSLCTASEGGWAGFCEGAELLNPFKMGTEIRHLVLLFGVKPPVPVPGQDVGVDLGTGCSSTVQSGRGLCGTRNHLAV